MKNFLKSDRFYYSTSLLITSISLIVVGLLMIIGKDTLYFNIMNIFISIILILGIFQFLKYLISINKKQISFMKSFLYLMFAIIISYIRNIPLSLFPLLFAIYMLFNGIIRLISYFLLLNDNANGKLFNLITSVIYFVIAFPLIFKPLKNISTMLILVGIYSLLLGLSFLINFLNSIISINIKKRFRITLPSLFAFILPYQVLKEINSYINEDNAVSLILEDKKEDYKPDLEIFVHVAPTSYNRFGHVDICYDNTVISYGAYDFTTSKFFNMIGDGMIFKVNRDNYIKYCTKYSNKTLFCFGLKLNNKQIISINKQINSIMNNVVPYDTLYEKDKRNKCIKKIYKDYPSNLGTKFKINFECLRLTPKIY